MESINWYKELDINQKINLKEVFVLLCGVEWQDIAILIPFRERIEIAYNKLNMIGINV